MLSFLKKQLLIIIILVVFIASIIMVVSENSTVQNLGLNFVSEVFGIILTVLVLDKVIKASEERRWKPARNFAYIKVIRFVSDLFFAILPHRYSRIPDQLYYFGEISGTPMFVPNELYDPKSEDLVYRIQYKVFHQRDQVIKDLQEIIEKIEEIISKYSMLLEPEVVSSLISIREKMDHHVKFHNNSKNDMSIDYLLMIDISKDLIIFVEEGKKIQDKLLEKADRSEPLDNLFRRLENRENILIDAKLLRRLETEPPKE